MTWGLRIFQGESFKGPAYPARKDYWAPLCPMYGGAVEKLPFPPLQGRRIMYFFLCGFSGLSGKERIGITQ